MTHTVDLSRLGLLGGALGDPTRFSLYRHVVAAAEPRSAGEVAEVFGLHRTVARSHLEKLVEAGLLRVGTRRRATGGRPAKVYSPSGERLEIQLPPRRYESLSQMLVTLTRQLNGTALARAEQVGVEHGRELAATLPRESGADHPSLETVMQSLEDRGCDPHIAGLEDGLLVLRVSNCLYYEVAQRAPDLVCTMSGGLLCGLLGVDPARHEQKASMLRGDDFCVHQFQL